MGAIAIKMLVGDRAKYIGLIFGILCATFLMAQQVSIFVGLMSRTAGQIRDVTEADVWVMDPMVRYFEEIKALPDRDLSRVRSVAGVEWAVPFFKGMAVVRARGGIMQQVVMVGVDDTTLIGQPRKMLMGSWEAIKQPGAMIMDKAGYNFIWPGQPIELGKTIEINDKRVVIVGICETSAPFMTFPIVYTKFSDAKLLVPGERNRMSFVLAKAQAGIDPKALATRITQETHLQALTGHDFQWRSINHYLTRTGIPINFGITVALGFIVGAAIAGQTFYIFVLENLRQFGALKAIGTTNGQILRMVLLQAAMVGFIGFGIGIGLAATFFAATADVPALRDFGLPWQVMALTAAAVLVIMLIAAGASLRKVWVLDPAEVFRG